MEECWSESCTASELVIFVSTHPVVSQRFPFLHGDETGTGTPSALSFRSHMSPKETAGGAAPSHRLRYGGDQQGWLRRSRSEIEALLGSSIEGAIEMYLPLWLRMWGALGIGTFNIRVVR